jgi:type IV secretory pathway TrbL component
MNTCPRCKERYTGKNHICRSQSTSSSEGGSAIGAFMDAVAESGEDVVEAVAEFAEAIRKPETETSSSSFGPPDTDYTSSGGSFESSGGSDSGGGGGDCGGCGGGD